MNTKREENATSLPKIMSGMNTTSTFGVTSALQDAKFLNPVI